MRNLITGGDRHENIKKLSIIFIIVGLIGTIISIINFILIGVSGKFAWILTVSLIVLAISICSLLAINESLKENKNN